MVSPHVPGGRDHDDAVRQLVVEGREVDGDGAVAEIHRRQEVAVAVAVEEPGRRGGGIEWDLFTLVALGISLYLMDRRTLSTCNSILF